MLQRCRIDVVIVTLSFLLSRSWSALRQPEMFAATAFTANPLIRPYNTPQIHRNKQCRCPVRFAQSDPGSSNSESRGIPVEKTYGTVPPTYRKDVIIDEEDAMMSFFNSREEWLPLFRSVAGTNLPKDTISLLNSITSSTTTTPTTPLTLNDIDHSTSFPWKRYDAIPSDEDDRTVVARFLDSMQEALLAIPVMEDPLSQIKALTKNGDDGIDDEEDENDIQFVEEGRRLLAINRFHVLSSLSSNNTNTNDNRKDSSTIEAVDELFRHCWSEIFVLSQEGNANSGSIILLPNQQEQYELSYLRRFLDMNIIQPLQWLGIYDDFEITSFQRDSPVIRMIYKLNDIPNTPYTEEDGFAAK